MAENKGTLHDVIHTDIKLIKSMLCWPKTTHAHTSIDIMIALDGSVS